MHLVARHQEVLLLFGKVIGTLERIEELGASPKLRDVGTPTARVVNSEIPAFSIDLVLTVIAGVRPNDKLAALGDTPFPQVLF